MFLPVARTAGIPPEFWGWGAGLLRTRERFLTSYLREAKMAQWEKALAAKPDCDLSSIPWTYVL